MENEFNNNIIKNIKERIIASNIEEQYYIKKRKKKNVFKATTLSVFILASSFLTVNATTDGNLKQSILNVVNNNIFSSQEKQEMKENIENKIKNLLGNEVKVTQLDVYTSEDGKLVVKYLFNTGAELNTIGDIVEDK